ncbi:MAG TPA: hypothetical protein VMV45_07715 [Casimicrobiaceae bacterium]|nr:hypothetical protein [Casimicrobiaceae bacterium]
MGTIRSVCAAIIGSKSSLLRGVVARSSAEAARPGTWLQRRAIERLAAQDFATLSQRQLLDIGVTHFDVERAIWATSPCGGSAEAALREAPRGSGEDHRTLVECAMWLHVGYIGTAILIVALLRFVSGETPWISAFAFAMIGSLLAIGGWRRAHRLLVVRGRRPERSGAAHALDRSRH